MSSDNAVALQNANGCSFGTTPQAFSLVPRSTSAVPPFLFRWKWRNGGGGSGNETNRHSDLLWHYYSSPGSYTAESKACAQYSLFALKAGGRKKAAEQSHQYNVVRWMGYLHMLVIIPGKLREARYKQLKVSQFVSLITRTKAIETNAQITLPIYYQAHCSVTCLWWCGLQPRRNGLYT